MAPDKMVGLAQELNVDQLKIFGEKFADYPVFGAVLGAKDDLNREAVAAALEGKTVKKEVYVPGRLVNIVAV